MRKLLFLLLAATLTISPHVTSAQEPATIRVAGPPNEGYKDVFYAVQSGLFRKYNLSVEPVIVSANVAIAGLAGGTYDVAYTNLVPVMQAHVHGVSLAIVSPSTMYSTDHSQNAMLVAKDSPLRTARDLNGKTIGTQSLQDLNSVAMRAWIDKNGGDAKTVHVLEVPSSVAVTALTEHRVDAMALSEPILREALQTGKVRIFAKPQDAIAKEFQSQAFVAMNDYVSTHQDVMGRFVRAMHESEIYNNAHMAETVNLVSSFTKVPADVIAHSVRSVDGEYADPKYIQPLIDAAAKYGMIPSAFPAEQIISSIVIKSKR